QWLQVTYLSLHPVPPCAAPEQAHLISCPPPSCLSCHPCSPGHSEGTRGPASHHNPPPPEKGRGMCPWLNWHQCRLILPGQTLRKRGQCAICSSSVILLRSGSPVRPNSCWLMVIFSRPYPSPSAPAVAIPASAAEAAAAPRASSSCRCRCSSIETRRDQHWDPLQIQSHWHQVPAWHHLHQPESEN
uniref:Uncharacterized protein n=1 Tax=Panthera tigris altaica TaxID=74533 RepID=A0A8C9M3R2_PANTA